MGELADAFAAAREGDEAGFALLWRTCRPGLLRYLRVVVGGAAEDVASETWLQVARDLSGYRGGPEGFQVWLFRVARHRAIDDRRWVRRRPEELVDPAAVPERVSADAWTQAVEHLDTEWALAVIGTLPPDQAEAVLLRVVVGLDVAGTAAVLRKRPRAGRGAALRGPRRLPQPPQGPGTPAAGTPRPAQGGGKPVGPPPPG